MALKRAVANGARTETPLTRLLEAAGQGNASAVAARPIDIVRNRLTAPTLLTISLQHNARHAGTEQNQQGSGVPGRKRIRLQVGACHVLHTQCQNHPENRAISDSWTAS